MPRCGCGDNSVIVEGGVGIDVTSSGSPARRYTVAFDGAEVLGQGIGWNASSNELSAKLQPGGGLAFDENGAIYSTEGGGDAQLLDLVAPLEARTEDVIIGALGKGYLVEPETLRESYSAGLGQYGLDAMHVPVRMLYDGTPVVHWDEILGRIIYHPYNRTVTHWTRQHVQDQLPARWASLPVPAGYYQQLAAHQPLNRYPVGNLGPNPLDFNSWDNARDHPVAPEFGWFGYMTKPQWGGTYLSEVFDLCAGRMPLVLHLIWPDRDSGGQFIHPTPGWRTEAFIRSVRTLVQRYRQQRSVIVTVGSGDITVPGGNDQPIDVLDFFASAQMRVGPTIRSPADLPTYPPAEFANRGWTWGILPSAATVAELEPYPTAGIHTVLSRVNRQYLRADLVQPSGAKGVVTGDPVYYSGPIGQWGHRYRDTVNKWEQLVIRPGQLHPFDTDLTRCRPHLRGTFHDEVEPGGGSEDLPQMYFTNTMRQEFPARTYWILNGWASPIAQPDNWSMNYTIQMDNWSGSDTSEWLGFTFGVATDHPFHDFPGDAQEPPRPGYELDSGYAFYVTQDSRVYLTLYDRGVWIETTSAALLTPLDPENPRESRKQFRVIVEPRGVTVCAVETGGILTILIRKTTEPYTRWRGGYSYFGRASPGNRNWIGRIIDPIFYPGRGTQDWDEARPRP